VFAPIIVGVLWLGVYPNSFLDVMHVSVENLIALSEPSKMGQAILTGQ
jgi:NADH-quinone oxidoreductase subunit M